MKTIVNGGFSPTNIHFLITDDCNLRCLRCYFYRGGEQYVDLASAMGVIRWASLHHVRSIAFGGGEPTLHPSLSLLCDWCFRLGVKPSVTTNGIKLVDFKAYNIHLSFDSLHCEASGKDSGWARERLNYYRSRCRFLGINHVFHNLDELINHTNVLGPLVDSFLIIYPKDYLDEIEWKKFIEWFHVARFIGMFKDKLMVDSCMRVNLHIGKCYQGLDSFCIYPDLGISKCSIMGKNVLEGCRWI